MTHQYRVWLSHAEVHSGPLVLITVIVGGVNGLSIMELSSAWDTIHDRSLRSKHSAVKHQFENIDVECWEERHRLGTTQRSVCLSHSKRAAGHELLEALAKLTAESPPAKRTLTFKSSFRKHSIGTLRLRLVPERPNLRVMSIAVDSTTATVEMTTAGLGVVRDGVQAWLEGAEDFGVGADQADFEKRDLGDLDKASLEMWFWGPTMEP